MEATRVTVVMTVINRREQTIACLRALHASSSWAGGIAMSVCLTDDGGTDGTSEAVSMEIPDSRILRGTGAFFGVMACAKPWRGLWRFARTTTFGSMTMCI